MPTPTLADQLAKFTNVHGVSGIEDQVRALVLREFDKLVDETRVTPLGSVIGIKRAKRRGSQPAPRLLIEAHMDEIGFLVTSIEEGFIRFDEVGMFDPRVLPSQNVIVHGKRPLPGIIGARPPHVLTHAERTRSIPLSDLFIDVGMPDPRVRELVTVGDFITMDRAVIPLQNKYIAGKALDDRCCLVVLIETLRRLQSIPHSWDIYAVANVNEEDSALYVGALTSAFGIEPQISITLDVTHARQPGLRDDAAPETNHGPCIARGANVHPAVFESLRTAAVQENIPHQITVYGDDTQTNAWMIQVSGAGVPTGLVEIPLRYMHTPVETIHLDDLAHTAELLSTWSASLTSEFAQALQGERFVRAPSARKQPAATRPSRKTPRQKTAARPKSRTPRTRRKR